MCEIYKYESNRIQYILIRFDFEAVSKLLKNFESKKFEYKLYVITIW